MESVIFAFTINRLGPATDKEFAPWAPREGDPAAVAYLSDLLAGIRD